MRSKAPIHRMNVISPKLAEAVSSFCCCECRHFGSIRVIESSASGIIFDGTIERFELKGHPEAKEAYAWSFVEDDNVERCIVIPKVPPINDPSDAVQQAIAEGRF